MAYRATGGGEGDGGKEIIFCHPRLRQRRRQVHGALRAQRPPIFAFATASSDRRPSPFFIMVTNSRYPLSAAALSPASSAARAAPKIDRARPRSRLRVARYADRAAA